MNRRTPLFALQSAAESNHVFTVVPQVAMAAIEGRLPPRPPAQDQNPNPTSMNLYQSVGATVSPYDAFTPSSCPPVTCTPAFWGTPLASASVMTTHTNPVSGGPVLAPLYRLSWYCNPANVTGICANGRSRHYYSTDPADVDAKIAAGYRLDGIEGFVYPANQTPLPGDAVALCRRYSSTRDDFIVYAGTTTALPGCDLTAGSVGAAVAGGAAYGAADIIGHAYAPAATAPMLPGPVATTVEPTGGGGQSTTVNTAFAQPLSVIVRDQANNPMSGVSVAFNAPASSFSATPASQSATTGAGGGASVNVSANATTGTYNVIASVAGATSASFMLTNTAGPAASISATAGTPQTGVVSQAFPTQLRATVRDASGNGVPNVNVTFAALGTGPNATLAATTVPTDIAGNASVTATANSIAGGPYDVSATVTGISPAVFKLTNATLAPTSIAVVSGANQSAVTGTGFASQLRARVLDQNGAPFAGVTVTFAGPAGGASVAPVSASAVTGTDGIAGVGIVANSLAGIYSVNATTPGVPGTASFPLTNVARVASSIAILDGSGQSANAGTAFAQPLRAIVRDQTSTPFGGAVVSFAGPVSGAGATLSPNPISTDSSGIAAVSATANGTGGGYVVNATTGGVAGSAAFNLTNVATCNTGPVTYESSLPSAYSTGPDMVLAVGWVAAFSFTVPPGAQASLRMIQHSNYWSYWLPSLAEISISKCKGDFSVTAPRCQYSVNQYGSITASSTPGPWYCTVEPNTTYYFNVRVAQCGSGYCGFKGYRNY